MGNDLKRFKQKNSNRKRRLRDKSQARRNLRYSSKFIVNQSLNEYFVEVDYFRFLVEMGFEDYLAS
jgi:hypothetical protein